MSKLLDEWLFCDASTVEITEQELRIFRATDAVLEIGKQEKGKRHG